MRIFARRIFFSFAAVALAIGPHVSPSESRAHAETGDKDEHTESALKRASQAEPKLVREHAIPVETVEVQTGSHGPAIKSGEVISGPAPAMRAAKEAAPAARHGPGDGVPAETSLRWLRNGNVRYVKKNLRKDGRDASDRSRLARGQKPHAIVLSCSDSRVPPEIVFDQALGEIFVIRVAGEALDSSVIASIEYAVEHLNTKLIVVMGHTQCGAVQAAVNAKDGGSAGSPDLDKLVADIRPRLRTVLKDEPSKSLEVESAVNADGVARDLVKRSDIIRHKVESGEVIVKTALYRLESGKVSFY